MAAPHDWVEVVKANGEIEAQIMAGSLETEGIDTHVEKATSAWRYGASDPFVLISIYVHEDELERARRVLDEASASDYDFGEMPEPQGDGDVGEMPQPYVRTSSLRWWVAAIVLAALIVGMMQLDFFDVLF